MLNFDFLLEVSFQRPFEDVRSTLKTLKSQMCELQNQAHQSSLASSMWKYKLGFTCEKCEMKWYLFLLESF